METQAQKQGPLQKIYTAILVVFLLAISVGGRYAKRLIYPSPVFPQENCKKPTEEGWQYCTIDRGLWGHDTIAFKHEAEKSPLTIDLKCVGNRQFTVIAKSDDISNSIASKYARSWCQNY